MQKIFFDTRELDKIAREKFALSEELMMENAALALEKAVLENIGQGVFIDRPAVLILCGKGNNGADGYALARRLQSKNISVTCSCFSNPETPLAKLQEERAKKIGVNEISFMELDSFIEEKSIDLKVIVDCIYGTGFHGELNCETETVLEEINKNEDAFKIACDIPSGIDLDGRCCKNTFCADLTVTMGAEKIALYSDEAKDFCGKIQIANLGISRENFESGLNPLAELLEEKDLVLPFRKKQNVHKGKYGHAVFVAGEKTGASVLAASSALRFGSGLVTLVTKKLNSGDRYSDSFIEENGLFLDENGFGMSRKEAKKLKNERMVPFEIMCSPEIPKTTTCLALGMGLGHDEETNVSYLNVLKKNPSLACLLDADIFYSEHLKDFLEERSRYCVEGKECQTVLTPHPKEFISILLKTGLASITMEELLKNKLSYVKKFCLHFPGLVLVLKGANVIIARHNVEDGKDIVLVNPLGSSSLAKGGSGDVLSGMIASLLAQGKNAINASKDASIAHALAGSKCQNTFSLTPFALIKNLENLM